MPPVQRDRGMPAIYRQSADGTGDAERLSDGSAEQQTPNGISADGKQLVFDRSGDRMLLALDGSRRVSPLVQTMFSEIRASLSPDGRWLAYHADESGQFEIYVRPFPAVNTGKAQISTASGVQPWWSHMGDELLYLAQTSALMNVEVGSGQGWSASPPAVVSATASACFHPPAPGSRTFWRHCPTRFTADKLWERSFVTGSGDGSG